MNISPPTLSPLFRSDAQAEILARLILNPDRAYTVADLARHTGAAYATVHREVQRLVDADLLRQERVGRAVLLAANTDNPAFRPVDELLRLSYGPAVVVPRELAGIDGVDEVYLHGSWAARRAGERGDAPGDVDVLVVGNPPRGPVLDAAGRAERVLGRPVDIRIVPVETWQAGEDLFIRTVRERPLVRVG